MGENVKQVHLNLGCGFNKFEGYINVDGFAICKPDVLWDLNKTPWPWRNLSVDSIHMNHVMEHLTDWVAALKECARILKYGGLLQINVPDHTSTASMGYIDHRHIFSLFSFHMTHQANKRGTNAWATEQSVIPLTMTHFYRVPHKKYVKWWIPKRLLWFCCNHLTNFCHEQRFTFIKNNPDREER